MSTQSPRRAVRRVLVQDLVNDVRYAIKALRRAPAFTLIAGGTLALGVGAATAVFSVVNGVIITPLPYPDPHALVSIRNASPSAPTAGDVPLSATQFFTYRDEHRVFAAFGMWSRGRATVTGSSAPEEVQTLQVTHGTLEALGVAPAMGRWFTREDDAPGSAETVVLANSYWKTRYGGETSVIGRTLTVDARPRTVIGVMPADFRFLEETPELLLPLRFEPGNLVLGAFNYFGLGRLKPGMTIEHATADAARMNRIWLEAWPAPAGFAKERFERVPVVRPLKHDVVGDIGDVLWVLMAMIGAVLVIACANVANLLLVRAERRRQELAVRAALGAGSRRIARELLIESVLLGLFGGALGLLLASAGVRVLSALGPATLPRLDQITIDATVLAFALVTSLASGIFFSVIPVLRYAGPQIVPLLRVADRTASESREQRRTRHALVVAQVSLALVLLIGAGLMIRTFLALHAVQPGFVAPDRIQLARFTIPRTLMDDPVRVFGMQSEIRARAAAIPGVSTAALASAAPMEPFVSANTVFAQDATAEAKVRRFKFVSPGYFATVGTPVIAGRDFDWADLEERRPVAVISADLARELWRQPAAAVGRRIRESPQGVWREVVGVVGDVFEDGVHTAPPAIAYWPAMLENFEGDAVRIRRSMTLVVRSDRAGSESLLRDIQQAVWAVNANLPLARVQTLQAIYDRSLMRTSFTLVTLAIAASIALLLGVVGIYGVTAYAVTQHAREIGIRIALGASPGDVTRMFIRRSIVLSATGIIVGLAAAVMMTRLMSSLLFGTTPADPATFAAVTVLLMLTTAIASYLPARRASHVDPVTTLRAQY